jgi:hypothetical protein
MKLSKRKEMAQKITRYGMGARKNGKEEPQTIRNRNNQERMVEKIRRRMAVDGFDVFAASNLGSADTPCGLWMNE